MPWTSGLTKSSRPTVGVKHCSAATPTTGSAPFATRTTQNGSTACFPRGWRSSTSRSPRRRPTCCGAAGFIPVCGGASPFWASSFTWTPDRQGVPRVTRRTARQKLYAACRRITTGMKQPRHLPGREFFQRLNTRLRGHYHYYGVRGNSRTLHRVFNWAMDGTFKWLHRRGGKRSSSTWEQFTQVLDRVKIARPHITEVRRRRVYA